MGKAEESQLHEDRRRVEWLERTDELAAKRALGPVAALDVCPVAKLRWVLHRLETTRCTFRQAVDECMRSWS